MARRTGLSVIGLLALVASSLVLFMAPAHALAYAVVNDAATPNDCGGRVANFTSIQAAVTAVDSGGLILVCPGTYNETVNVNKSLTIQGYQHGVPTSSRTPGGPNESTVQGNSTTGVFYVTASNVLIDGFTVQNNAQGPGIYVAGGTNNDNIQNNIVRSNVFGVYFNGTNNLLHDNLITNNNQAGSASGNGVYGDQGAYNLSIYRNTITNQGQGILYSSTNGSTSCNDLPPINFVNIYSNTIRDVAGGFILFICGNNVSIHDNTLSNTAAPNFGASGIYLADVTNTKVYSNTITRANRSGVYIDCYGLFTETVPTGVSIYSNSITGSGTNGITVGCSTTGGVTTYSNTANNNAQYGLDYEAAANGNLIKANTATGNWLDCLDQGHNTWNSNRGNSASPPGICTPAGNTVVTT